MDKTSKLFDVWAKTGRSEEMEKGHGTTVNQFLDKLSLKEKFNSLSNFQKKNLREMILDNTKQYTRKNGKILFPWEVLVLTARNS